jgi:GNAT superfamily N-acetyltransferase
LVIRLGTAADYPGAAAVYRRASLSNAGDREYLLAHPEHLVLAPEALTGGRTLVAEQDGSVVGFASWLEVADGVELDDLFVDPAWRRRGIATALVIGIVEVLRARGVSHLEVTANPHALAFYREVGFVDIGQATTESGTAPRMALTIR